MAKKIIEKLLNIVLVIGEDSVSSCCIYWLYQPKVPKNFKNKKNK